MIGVPAVRHRMKGGVAAPVLPTPEKKFAGVTYEKKVFNIICRLYLPGP